MYIYLKRSETLEKMIEFKGEKGNQSAFLGSTYVGNYKGVLAPYIQVSDPFTVLAQCEELSKIFLKATGISFPIYLSKREFGIYHFGKAKAELTVDQNSPYCLKIETDYWEGIKDMFTIQQKIAMGKIRPTNSYEGVQRSKNLITLIITPLVEIFKDAISFIRDPDARVVSDFKYPNGNPMSLREAKKNNLV